MGWGLRNNFWSGTPWHQGPPDQVISASTATAGETETHVRAHVFVCATSVRLLALPGKILNQACKVLRALDALRRLDRPMQVVLEQAGRPTRTATRTNTQQEKLLAPLQVGPAF